mgnify:CR=1 FL=1
MKLLQFPKHWWKYPIRLTVMEKFLWKTSSMEDRNFQSFRFFGLRILMPTLAKEYRYEGLSGETYPDRKKGAHRGVFIEKADYDTIFGSAGMWNAYGYRMG